MLFLMMYFDFTDLFFASAYKIIYLSHFSNFLCCVMLLHEISGELSALVLSIEVYWLCND